MMHLIGHIIGGATGVGYFLERAFARFFNKLTKIITINNSDYLLDSIGESTRVAEPTQVVDSTYSAEVWIDADSAIGDLDSMTIDSESGEAAVSYVYQTGQTINTVSGRDGYRITLLTTQKQGNLKLKDLSGEIIAQYLLDEKEGIITFNRLVNNTYAINHGELVSATLPDARITSIEIEGVQNDLGYSVADGTELSGTVTVGARIPINPNSRTKDIFDNSATYTGKAGNHLKAVGQNCIKGDGTAYLAFASLPTYDTITVNEDGTDVEISLSSGNWTPTSGKYYSDIRLSLSDVIVARFPLNEYDKESSPSTVVYNDVMGTGATLTLTNGTVGVGGNLQSMDGVSWNFSNRYATITATSDSVKYPALADGSGYAGLTGNEAGFTEYPAYNNTSEQAVKAPQSYEFIEKDKAFKVCTSSGTTYIQSSQAYGVWEFDLEYDKTTFPDIFIIADTTQSGLANSGYRITPNTLGMIYFAKEVNGTNIDLFNTTVNYIEGGVKYRLLDVRLEEEGKILDVYPELEGIIPDLSINNTIYPVGTFFLYIKGGDFGNEYVLVDTTGGYGTNPVTDKTYTTSDYLAADLDIGDKFGNLSKNDTPVPITDFTDGTGTFNIEGNFFETDGTQKDVLISDISNNDYIDISSINNEVTDFKIKK